MRDKKIERSQFRIQALDSFFCVQTTETKAKGFFVGTTNSVL